MILPLGNYQTYNKNARFMKQELQSHIIIRKLTTNIQKEYKIILFL